MCADAQTHLKSARNNMRPGGPGGPQCLPRKMPAAIYSLFSAVCRSVEALVVSASHWRSRIFVES